MSGQRSRPLGGAHRLPVLLLGFLLAAALPAIAPGGVREAHAAAPAGRYHPLGVPQRLVDSRKGIGLSGPLQPEASGVISLAGANGLPTVAQGLTAVVLNAGVTDTDDIGYLTLWPAGGTAPVVSNLNWMAGDTVANLVVVGVSAAGIGYYNNHSHSQVFMDIEGFFQSDPGTAGLYRPLMPARIADTRSGLGGGPAGPLGAGAILPVQVGGVGNVPAGAAAVVLNLTETGATANSYLAAFPYSSGYPANTSNLNFRAGSTRAVRAIVRLDAQGRIGILNSAGLAHVIVDVAGWFTDGSDPAAAGGHFFPIDPNRILDTRSGKGRSGPLGPGEAFDLPVTGSTTGLPAGASAVVMNLTSVAPTAPNFVVAYPAGNARVLASDVNSVPGGPTPNLAFTALSAAGLATLFNSAGTTHLVADAVGYFEAAPVSGTAPGAPATVTAAPGDRSATISWSPPAATGGSQVVSYLVSVAGQVPQAVDATVTSLSWPGLTNATSYSFTVTAINGVRSGPAGGPATVTPVGTPDAPVGLSAASGPGTVTVNWSAPANNGGAAIAGYYVTVDQTGQRIGTPAITPITFSLPPGTYSISVAAINAYGVGPAADTGPVIPGGVRKIVISLAAQHLWAYEAGQLRLETDVTTGRPALPTPPGDYHIFYRSSPYHMVSPWPVWSQYYYDPVDLQYAMEFLEGGYFLHDAYWRTWYGPGSNVYDGTHGCVNVPLTPMAWLYGWAQNGDEVIIQ